MANEYSLVVGRFGTLKVIEVQHHLTIHASEKIQFGYWLSGGQAHCQVAGGHATYNDASLVGINRYQSHDFKLDDLQAPAVVLFLNIDLEWLDEVTRDFTSPVVLTQAQIVSTPEIQIAAKALMHQVLTLQEINHKTLENDVLVLLKLTLNQTDLNLRSVLWTTRRKLLDHRVRHALTYMEKNLQLESNIAQLSLSVGISRSRLFELFQSELDSSPQVIWTCLRMKLARNELAMAADPLSFVASSLGFSNPGNFARAFRSIEGVSASHYRKQNLFNKQRGEQLCAVSYTSQASHVMRQGDLDQLLLQASARNQVLNITGVLLYVEGCFMQYLEGPRSSLWEVLRLITLSHQHHHINLGEILPIQQRAYPMWHMICVTRQTVLTPNLLQPNLQKFLQGQPMGYASSPCA